MAHSNGWDFWCNIGESGGVIMWPTKMSGILGGNIGESGGLFKWPTTMGEFWVHFS